MAYGRGTMMAEGREHSIDFPCVTLGDSLTKALRRLGYWLKGWYCWMWGHRYSALVYKDPPYTIVADHLDVNVPVVALKGDEVIQQIGGVVPLLPIPLADYPTGYSRCCWRCRKIQGNWNNISFGC